MTNQTQRSSISKYVPALLAGVFIVVFYVLIFQGGFCERYERKMLRRELMQQQLDEMRR